MPRRTRKDYPGAWHHVMDRGVARRTLFETGKDARTLLACLARQVRIGDLEVHVYTVMTTHFHLLVRSPRGRLSAAMQRALDAYARWFNRSRRRDGPLFRGRFVNRLVEDEDYLVAVVRYIDRNPLDAGLVTRPEAHPFGSARHYLEGTCPPWLSKGEILCRLRRHGGGIEDAEAYREVFGAGGEVPGNAWVVERRLQEDPASGERARSLAEQAPPLVQERLQRRNLLADGTRPVEVLLVPETVLAVARSAASGWDTTLREAMGCGALRLLSGLRHDEMSARLGLSTTSVRRRLAAHGEAMRKDDGYRVAFGSLLDRAIPGVPQVEGTVP